MSWDLDSLDRAWDKEKIERKIVDFCGVLGKMVIFMWFFDNKFENNIGE
jgi:hypothetical protein